MKVLRGSARSFSLSLLLIAAVLTGGAAAQAPGGTPGSAGAGDPYWPEDGNGGYDALRYDVRDTYLLSTGRLRGTTVMTARAKQSLSRFNLDLLLDVGEVTVDGRPARARKAGAHEVVVTPSRPIAMGATFEVKIAYAGQPGELSYAGESNWLHSDVEALAMNEPHMAPWWFAASDHPSDKAIFDLRMSVPHGNQVISNGMQRGKAKRGKRFTTYHWAGGGPMATYLAFAAIGKFEVAKGVFAGRPWLVAVSKQIPRAGRVEGMRVLKRTPAYTRWLETKLGPYPFSSTGGVITSLHSGFALENQTRPIYEQMGDNAGARSTVIHELAHQWFGDSVAVKQWDDIWLNEGAATFMEVIWAESNGGMNAQDWMTGNYDANAPTSQFWQLRLDAPGKAFIFDGIIYERGAMVFQALRHRLGDEVFWPMIRGYVAKYRHANASIADFRAFAAATTGEDLTGFFDAWLSGTTKPARTAANGF